jgi:hypothetical protein
VSDRVTIAQRFRGPPDSANGGYTCGLLARFLDAPVAAVSLRAPPPLERPLEIVGDGDRVEMRDGDTLVAEAEALDGLDLEPPPPVAFEDAAAASRRSPLFERHPFPTCFVCGPEREPGDGLRVHPGPVTGSDLVAAPWTPDRGLADEDGRIPSEIEWAALDCPSGNALMMTSSLLEMPVLARLATRLVAPVEPGADHVAVGWPLGVEGRKAHSGSALFTADGELVGMGRALWIDLKR